MDNAVDSAMSLVSYDAYVRQPDGMLLPQSSSPAIIAAMLHLLNVQPGMRILEIGTGSGYSTALIATLVGQTGSVISLDIDPSLVRRARRLLSLQGLSWVKVVAKDGRDGCFSAAPFDRLIVWATGNALPEKWIQQMHPSSIIVAPIQLLPLANTTAVVQFQIDQSGTPAGKQLIPGGFVRLSDQARYHWRGYAEEADIAILENNHPVAWVSTEWLQHEVATDHKPALLQMLLTAAHKDSPLSPEEDINKLRAYLLATRPQSLTTASTPRLEANDAMGCSQPRSLALLGQVANSYVESGTDEAAKTLRQWISDWRAAGQPGFDQLKAQCQKVDSNWKVQATLSPQSRD
jgi:protein-L-isoaspartate(D-aspartate) O-methyltransferase